MSKANEAKNGDDAMESDVVANPVDESKAAFGASVPVNLSENPQIMVLEDRKQATVSLFYPIGDAGEINSLTMRRPLVRDTIVAEKVAEGSRSDMFIARLANLCEVTFSDFETLDELEDLENLTEAYGLLKASKHKTAEANPNIVMADDRRSCEILLNHPLQNGQISSLVLRRPTLRDSTEAEKQSEYQTEVLTHKYAALCSVPVDVITSLDDIDDFTSLDQAYGMFRRPKAHR